MLGAVPLAIWCYLLLGRGQFWLARQPETIAFSELKPKRVAAIIPARNEAPVVGKALRSLIAQDYPLQAFLVDDESSDRTTAVAQEVAESLGEAKRLTIVEAGPRPPGWTGKLWAVSQGVRQAGTWNPDYYLLTDADVVHDTSAVAQLVARAEGGRYDFVSLMVELRCETFAERALVPAFVFFFFLGFGIALRRRSVLQPVHIGGVHLLAGGHDFVQRGDGMPGADFAGVFLVVVEVLGRQRAVFVADEPIAGDFRGVEFHL